MGGVVQLLGSQVFWQHQVLRGAGGQGRKKYSALEPHASTLAWKIPWMEEPGGLQSVGSLESDATE